MLCSPRHRPYPSTASPSLLAGSKIAVLSAVVFTLFGAMNVLAGVLVLLDSRDRLKTLRRIRRERFGFRHPGPHVWLWNFPQIPIASAVGHLSGPAVELMEIVGLPFVRRAPAAARSPRARFHYFRREQDTLLLSAAVSLYLLADQ